MNQDKYEGFIKRMNDTSKDFGSWELKDQLAYICALDHFFDEIKPIIDKYDPQKPKKFIMRRLDET